jgi:replicative DNA helicase
MSITIDNILIEAEQHFLGFCLFNPDVFAETSICTDDLLVAAHRAIYGAMRRLYDSGLTPTLILLVDHLESTKSLEAIGGRAAIAQILEGGELVPTPWQDLEALIKKRALQRKLRDIGGRIQAIAQDNLATPSEALEKCQDLLFSVQSSKTAHKLLDPGEYSLELYDYLSNPPKQPMQFGPEYHELDRHLGGITEGVTVVAGETSMGKSHVLLWFSSLLLKRYSAPVLYVTPEMSRHQIGVRMLAHLSGVDSRHVAGLRREPSSPYWSRVAEAIQELSGMPWYVNDHEAPTMSAIEADIRKIVSRHGYIGGIVVDYLQQLPPVPGYPADSPQELGRRVQLLHNLARKYSCPIWLGCQINRGTTATADKRPNKNHLRGSGEIPEKAENVILLFRPGHYSKDPHDDTLEFIIEKARNGVTGVVKLTYDFRTSYLSGVKL